MCGLAGIITNTSSIIQYNRSILLKNIKKMTDVLSHRGPDGEGSWINENESVALGHRRLSLIDGSKAAEQPMHRSYFNTQPTLGERFSIVFTGEIYNYLELKETLYKIGYRFQSRSHAEVVLAAYDYWKEDALQKLNGMFAFAIWDAKKRRLFAARDRFGEQPFYFFKDHSHFVFASEMKALWTAGVHKTADNKMLLNYLALGYVQNAEDKTQTFYKDILSLPPGHFMYVNINTFDYEIHPYFKIDKEIAQTISADEAIEKFNYLLTASVAKSVRNESAAGSNLTGSIDSASLAALFNGQAGGNKFQTFSTTFAGLEKSDAKYIQTITKRFQIKNHVVIPTANGLMDSFEKLCYHQEEPFPSVASYAQYKLYQMAKEHNVKVLLDAQGSNEILAGYHHYIQWYIQQLISRKKYGDAMQEKRLFHQNDVAFKWGIGNILATYLPAHAAIRQEQNAYNKIIRQPDLNKDFINALTGREWEGIHKPIITKLNDILYFNSFQTGLEEQLRFSDRNSMAHGLEIRKPFLSHELVAFVFSLPANMKIHDGWTKWILRKAAAKKLPKDVVWRKDSNHFLSVQNTWKASPLVTDAIYEAKKTLVSRGILKADTLKKTNDSKENENPYDWRYLCLAQILAPK